MKRVVQVGVAMEFEFIHWLRGRLASHPQLLVGPGDDAAVLRLVQGDVCVLTTDLLTDGVDFQLENIDPRRVGRKALAVNLSDLAAMAARPVAAVISLALPRHGGLELAKALFEGLIPLAQRYDVAIAGGDTNSWDGRLVISVTLVGEANPAGSLLRSGARAGDVIVVSGQFGGSILDKHLDFEPRVSEAMWVMEHLRVHAGIDVSDGLSLDLSRIADGSRCGAVIDADLVPIAPAARELARQLGDGVTPLDHALSDGEDFELILAMPKDDAGELVRRQPLACGWTAIGEFTSEPGLWITDAAGVRRRLAPRGFEHSFD